MILELIFALECEEERDATLNIFLTYYSKMRNLAYYILQNYHDAEDAAMNAMVKIIESADKFVNIDTKEMEAKVVIYTRNIAKSMYRARKRYRNSTISMTIYSDEEMSESQQMDIPDKDEDVQRIAINNETISLMQKALLQLNEEQRDILSMKYFYQYSYTEIAKIFEISENTIKTKACRARQKLKELLGEAAYERITF